MPNFSLKLYITQNQPIKIFGYKLLNADEIKKLLN